MKTLTIPLFATLLTVRIGGASARAADVIETISSAPNYSTFPGPSHTVGACGDGEGTQGLHGLCAGEQCLRPAACRDGR
jgi:hypothetical protein